MDEEPTWNDAADVVVVGFGAAGACAAIESADAGAEVLVLDRFAGGGASAISGGVVYAGAGTTVQIEAGVADDVDAMFAYLQHETRGAVGDATLRRFCEESPAMIRWLQLEGVPFDGSLAPYKTSYPTNRHYLYYSGSELSARELATPAPRGHRAYGSGTSGKTLFAALRGAVARRGVRVQAQTRAVGLVTDDAGRVVGVECLTMAGAPRRAVRQHAWLAGKVGKLNLWYRPLGKRLSARLLRLETKHARPYLVQARHGVVLSAGGFGFNRAMVKEYAAPYAAGLPLGTLGDDGTGIELGRSVGGATKHLDRMSAWRFFTPPSALAKGVLLGPDGDRVCDEGLYGAAVAEAVIHDHGGTAHLLIDQTILTEARAQVREQTLWFQRLQTRWMLGGGRVEAATIAEVAAKVGIDPAAAEKTVDVYNGRAAEGTDPLGKADALVQPLTSPPYSLIDVSVRSSVRFPCPTMSLGGLVVDETTGQVLTDTRAVVPGLYAAGRTAAGLCSQSYVSGLSLADCVFSGRRAGRHAGAAHHSAHHADHEIEGATDAV